MTDYADLNSALEEQLARTTRFVRAAFHVHSIESHDWGKEADPATNNRDLFTGREGQERYLDALVEPPRDSWRRFLLSGLSRSRLLVLDGGELVTAAV
jgi:hypothetical protein